MFALTCLAMKFSFLRFDAMKLREETKMLQIYVLRLEAT